MSVFITIPKKGNDIECSNHCTIALISHASKVMFKVLRARLQQYVNRELPEVQAGFRKGRGTRDQTANIHWIIKKEEKFQKSIYFCFIDYAKAFVWITTSCGKFLKTWKYNTILPASWETCMQVKKQQLESDMTQWTGSKLGKEYDKAEHHVWNARLDESQAGIKISGINIKNFRYADDTTLMRESEEEQKSLLMRMKKESETARLKLNIQKTKIMASITSWQIEGEKVETVTGFILGSPKSLLTVTVAMKLKRQSFRLCGRRRGWDVSREQHRNMYSI